MVNNILLIIISISVRVKNYKNKMQIVIKQNFLFEEGESNRSPL